MAGVSIMVITRWTVRICLSLPGLGVASRPCACIAPRIFILSILSSNDEIEIEEPDCKRCSSISFGEDRADQGFQCFHAGQGRGARVEPGQEFCVALGA